MITQPAPPPRGRLARATDWILLLGLLVAFLATGVAFCGHWHWYADLFAHFRPQYVIGFALVLGIFVTRRKWTPAALALAGVAINLAVVWPHAEKRETAATQNAAKVRVVSFNLLQGNKDVEAAERFLRRCEADVIVFQEVTPDTAEILRKLAPIYPGQFLRPSKNSKGTAILTRLPAKDFRFELAPGEELIGANIAELEGPAGPFTVVGVHSHKPTSEKGAASQAKYFDWIATRSAQLQQNGTPVVIAGDFNTTPWSLKFKQFTAACPFADTSRGVLFGATWSVGLPQCLMIDHVFISPEWRLLKREVGPDAGSDHRPLIVDLVQTR